MASTPTPIPDSAIDIEAVRARLVEHKSKNGLSWGDIAKFTGIPQGTISSFASANYNADNAPLAAKVQRWFDTEAEQALVASTVAVKAPGFVETIAARDTFRLLTWAQRGKIVTVVAPPGFGKTSALRQYAATRSQVWLATCSPTSSDVSSMLRGVLAAMGDKEARGTPDNLAKRVRDRAENSGGLIILDEAQLCSEQALEEVRAIHDAIGIGIALVGNETLQARIEQGGKRKATVQLSSRVSMPLKHKDPHPEDFEAIAREWGLEDPRILAWMRQLAKQPGALRAQRNVIEAASLIAAGEGSPVTLKHLVDAWGWLSARPIAG